MHLHRRTLLAGGAAMAALGVPVRSHASLSLGTMTVETVSDGFLNLPGDLFFGRMPQDELLPILQKHGLSRDQQTPPCNITLMRSGDQVVLFDVGSGTDFMPNSGVLLESLDAAGVAPEEVTDVVFTHAHPDHLWGLLDDFDDLLFPDARYVIGRAEWDYWMNPNTVSEIGEARAAFAVGAQRRLALLSDQIELIDPGAEVLPGVTAVESFGHTPGHMAFEIRSGNEAALVVGDAIPNSHVAFEKPDWPSGADHDGDAAARTRRALLDQLASEGMPFIGFHIPDSGIGRVERRGDGFHFIAEA